MDLGEISVVWSWQAFSLAFLTGFVFGFGIVARLARSESWHWERSHTPKGIAWNVGILTAWLVFALVLSQALAGILEGDPLWHRALSRIFPYLVGAFGVGIGTYAGLRMSEAKP